MTRLRTVSAQDPGWTRRRCGRGFVHLDADGQRLSPDAVERIKSLAIPPAWRDVWICPDPLGHLQAVGTDDAGRLQYVYHPEWRRKRDLAKHERALTMASRLPAVRRRIRQSLPADVPAREAVLDLAVRLVDLGCFRLGSEDYAESYGSFGLTTLELQHVERVPAGYAISYGGKSGVAQEVVIDDPQVTASLKHLVRRRDPHARLLACREGRRWVALRAWPSRWVPRNPRPRAPDGRDRCAQRWRRRRNFSATRLPWRSPPTWTPG